MNLSDHIIGGLFALSAAMMWAVASIMWRKLGDSVSSLAMNLGKGLVALVILGAIFAVTGIGHIPGRDWLMLSVSGLLGITLGDTLFFLALMRLGPRRMLLMDALIPVATAGLAFAILGERLTPMGWVGGVLVIGGVVWVMRERMPQNVGDAPGEGGGGWLALGAVACNAVSILLAKGAASTTDPIDATFVRILAGVAGLVVYGGVRMELRTWLAPFAKPRLLGVLVVASVIGTFFGIWFAQAALTHTTATVATILKGTTPIFILPLAIIFLKEKISPRAVVGAVVAVVGVAILFLR
jgi:drug/metabolite transporter (DMT)-like permease